MQVPFHVRQALDSGMSASRIRSREFDAPFHGVRVAAGVELGAEELCRAYSVKMRRDAMFSNVTAAAIWGLPLPAHVSASPIHVTAPLGTAPIRGRGVAGHHHRMDVQPVLVRGLRVLDPATTWISLGATLSIPDLVAVGDALVTSPRNGRAMTGVLDLAAASAAFSGGRGSKALRAALAFIRPGALSRPESLLRVLLVAAGVPEPEINFRIEELRVVIDLAWPAFRFGIEYDGGYHRDPTQFAADIGRQELVHDDGWLLMRVTKEGLFKDPHGVIRRARSRLAGRGCLMPLREISQSVLPRA